jgi:hypothetical protein
VHTENVPTENSIHAILAEMKQFIATRVNLLRSEMNEKGRALKHVIPVLGIAAALLIAGWMALTFALIALLQTMFLPSVYAWLWASLIVGGVYMVLAAVIGRMAINELKVTHFAPRRTLTVLKQDKVWIQNEVRTI